jgi:hypothetical protein
LPFIRVHPRSSAGKNAGASILFGEKDLPGGNASLTRSDRVGKTISRNGRDDPRLRVDTSDAFVIVLCYE